MPFTLAHPAAVLPLRALPFMALPPLIVGSLTPDLIGFLPYQLERTLLNSHSFLGTVLLDLPVGCLVLFMLMLFRNALVRPLWEPHRAIIADSLNSHFTHPRHWLIALPSLLAGSWTHIVWDSFTHVNYWTYRHFPVLYRPLFPDGLHHLALFHALQYLTSALGLTYIGWCYWQHVRRTRYAPVKPSLTHTTSRQEILLMLGLVAMALLAGLVRLLSASIEFDSIYARLSMVLKTALISFMLLYFASGVILSKATVRQS